MCDEEFLESGELAAFELFQYLGKIINAASICFWGARYARKNAGVGDKSTETSAKANTIALAP